MKFHKSIMSAAVSLLALGASQVQATDLEVTHWWTSGGEAAAVKVFADAFNEGGDNWIDGAIAGSGSVARPVIISRILGGKPMGATQLNHGRQAEELVEEGLMLDLTELAEKEDWASIVRPAKLLESCTLDGKIYCVPVNIHSFQWMWTSLDAYKAAGVEPPTDWNSFVESAEALRGAGLIPLAVGNQAWQINGMFGVIQTALGGPDLYRDTIVERKSEALRGEAMAAVWKAFGEARSLADPQNSILNWNDATNQVITAKAGAQIMGDWAQGEFQVAGQTAGTEYDCLPGLGLQPTLDTGGDAFYFPVNDDPEVTAAQMRMASMMISKPVCMKKGIAILEKPENILPSGDQSFAADTTGQLEDLLTEFWSDPSMNAEDAHLTWAGIIEDAE